MKPYPRESKSSTTNEPERSVLAVLRKAITVAEDRSPCGVGLRLPFDSKVAIALAAAGADVVMDYDAGIAGITIPESGRSVSDLFDHDAMREQESSFRRGFHHGAAYAASAIKSGAKPRQLQEWLGRVQSWRFGRDDSPLPPEVFNQSGGAA